MRMRLGRLVPAVAMAAVQVVQAAEPQSAMPPALLEAIAGAEPYVSLVEYGLPLLNTSQEVAALSVELRSSQAAAIKRVLMLQMARARTERHRISSENYQTCAACAREWGAPPVFAAYLQLEGSGELNSRRRYVVREALRQLYEDYRVNALAIRYFVESMQLTPDEALAVDEWLPLENFFNLVPKSEITAQRVKAETAELPALLDSLIGCYAGVGDYEQAEEAVETLQPLMARFVTIAAGRYAPIQDEASRVELIESKIKNLNEQRKRVRDLNYCDSRRLRMLDFLFN